MGKKKPKAASAKASVVPGGANETEADAAEVEDDWSDDADETEAVETVVVKPEEPVTVEVKTETATVDSTPPQPVSLTRLPGPFRKFL